MGAFTLSLMAKVSGLILRGCLVFGLTLNAIWKSPQNIWDVGCNDYKKYPKFSDGASILLTHTKGRAIWPIPQYWIIYFLVFAKIVRLNAHDKSKIQNCLTTTKAQSALGKGKG